MTPLRQKIAQRLVSAQHEAAMLTTFNDVGGPRIYKLTKDADVTVMMRVDGKLQVNEALKAGELSKDRIAALVKSSEKIIN